MEQYFDQLRSFKLMRKRDSDEAAMKTYLELLMNQEDPIQLRIPETLLLGYSASGPALMYTGSRGVKVVTNAGTQHVADFITLCTQGQSTAFRSPLCVARQETPTVIMDTLAVSSLWHKCVAAQKKLILQKFILSPGDRQTLAQAKWKSGVTSTLFFANKHPHCDQGSYMKLYNSVTAEERFLTAPMNSSIAPESANISQVQEMMDVIAFTLKRFFKASSFSEVEEFSVEFVQDVDLNWSAIRLLYYELDRKPRTISRSKLQRVQMSRSHATSMRASPKRHAIKKDVYKGSALTFAVSPLELKQAVKMFDKRKRIRSSFMGSAMKKSLSKSLNTSVTLTKVQLEDDVDMNTKKVEDMLPIFQFPTPKGNPHCKTLSASFIDDDGLGLLKCPMKDRITLIRDHIIRQNNSLYTRIHYQVELPEKRLMKEIYSNAVNKVVTEMERLRAKARVARESLNQMKARSKEV